MGRRKKKAAEETAVEGAELPALESDEVLMPPLEEQEPVAYAEPTPAPSEEPKPKAFVAKKTGKAKPSTRHLKLFGEE